MHLQTTIGWNEAKSIAYLNQITSEITLPLLTQITLRKYPNYLTHITLPKLSCQIPNIQLVQIVYPKNFIDIALTNCTKVSPGYT